MEIASKANEVVEEIRPLSEAELDQVEGGLAVLAVAAAFVWGFAVGRYC